MRNPIISRFAVAACLSAQAFSAQPEHLDVPTLNDAFRRLADAEAAEECGTPFGWNDGENRIFERGEWKIAYNDREVTQIKVAKGEDVRQFADFLLKEPWRKRLCPRLREGAELSPGERAAIRIVYLAWIDSLRELTSLGYQHLSFHECVNSREFLKDKKDVVFGDGSIYGDLLQNFYDRKHRSAESVSDIPAWGAGFVESRNDRRDLLKRIIHGGNEKHVSAMKPQQLNEYFYVAPRVSDFRGETKVDGGTGVSQIASWRRIAREVLFEIGILASIREDIGTWRDSFEATSLPEKAASELEDEMGHIASELDAANEEAVRRARLVFFDFPLSHACLAFKRDIAGSTSWTYSRDTELENLKKAARTFQGNIAGYKMLENIKAPYAAGEYAASMEAFKKAAKKDAFRLLQETGVRELGADTMSRIAEESDLWSSNNIPDPYANLDDFRREILADASNALARASVVRTQSAMALDEIGPVRKSAKGLENRISLVRAEVEDTLASALDIPEAKETAAQARRLADEAASEISAANQKIDFVERGNIRIRTLSEEIEKGRNEAILNASDSPDIARKAASDAMDHAIEAGNEVAKCEEAVRNAKEAAKSAGEIVEKADRLAGEAALARKAEERRVADEKRDAALSAKERAHVAERKANDAKAVAAAAKQTAERAISDCVPTEKSHLDIPEIQTVAREAKDAAEAALEAVRKANAVISESLNFVARADSSGNMALEKTALVHSNEIARVVREALAAGITASSVAADLSEQAGVCATDAESLAEKARSKAAEAEEMATRSGADRRTEERRVAKEKRKQVEDAMSENDGSARVLEAAKKRSANAIGKATAAKQDCDPTIDTHLDIPETVELARKARKIGDASITAAKEAGNKVEKSENRIRKSAAQIEIALSQVVTALDDSRSTDDIRNALDRAIAAAADATGFAREGREAAEAAETLSLDSEAKAEDAAEKADQAAVERRSAEKSMAEAKTKEAEEAKAKARDAESMSDDAIARAGRAEEAAGFARLGIEERLKDNTLSDEERKAAKEARRAAGAAKSSAKDAVSAAMDSKSAAEKAKKSAETAIANAATAIVGTEPPKAVREALDKAIRAARDAAKKAEDARKYAEEAVLEAEKTEKETHIARFGPSPM